VDRRSDELETGIPPAGAALALRHRTLCRLEEALRLLVARHGARMTLGELFAVTAGMARLCRQEQVSLAEIAEATGLPKQNLSRWAKKRVGDSIFLKVNEDDQRRHDLVMTDARRAQAHIERLARVLGTDTD
jgi:hypothetical protein